jgi:hypothetical protein
LLSRKNRFPKRLASIYPAVKLPFHAPTLAQGVGQKRSNPHIARKTTRTADAREIPRALRRLWVATLEANVVNDDPPPDPWPSPRAPLSGAHAGKVKKFSSSSWCYARKIQLKLNSLFTTKPLEPSRERLYW